MYTRDEAKAITDKILNMAKADAVEVDLSGGERSGTRWANSTITTNLVQYDRNVSVTLYKGQRSGFASTRDFSDAGLQAMIAAVGDNQTALRIHRNVVRRFEFDGAGTELAEGSDEYAVLREFRNARDGVGCGIGLLAGMSFGDEDIAVRRNDDARRLGERVGRSGHGDGEGVDVRVRKCHFQRIQRQIDGVEFDVAHRMHQGRQTESGIRRALWHVNWFDQTRTCRSSWHRLLGQQVLCGVYHQIGGQWPCGTHRLDLTVGVIVLQCSER